MKFEDKMISLLKYKLESHQPQEELYLQLFAIHYMRDFLDQSSRSLISLSHLLAGRINIRLGNFREALIDIKRSKCTSVDEEYLKETEKEFKEQLLFFLLEPSFIFKESHLDFIAKNLIELKLEDKVIFSGLSRAMLRLGNLTKSLKLREMSGTLRLYNYE